MPSIIYHTGTHTGRKFDTTENSKIVADTDNSRVTEPVPVSAYVGSSKNLKDLKEHK